MRSAVFLLGGLVLIAAGVAVVMLEMPGRWIVAPVLVVAGVALKLVAVLRDPPPATGGTGRTKTTLGTAAPSAPDAAPERAMTARTVRARQTGQVSWR